MSTINDGGPAYPIPGMQNDGMSMRDHFAGLAMSAMIAEPLQPGVSGINYHVLVAAVGEDAAIKLSVPTQLAISAYILADAMLAERTRVQK